MLLGFFLLMSASCQLFYVGVNSQKLYTLMDYSGYDCFFVDHFASLQSKVLFPGSQGESFVHVEPTFYESDHPGREPETSVVACIRPQSSRVDSSHQVLVCRIKDE